MIKKIFSDIRSYILIFCLIPVIILGGRLLKHYDHQIIEVLEQNAESEKTIEVSKVVLRTQSLSLYGTVKRDYSYSEFKDGLISGSLFFDYYFEDGSIESDKVNIKDFYEHSIPGIGSKRKRKPFIKGKYKTRSGEIVELNSNEKLSIGDYADQEFDYQYEWGELNINLDPINTKAYFSKKTSNGKVTVRSEVPYEIRIIP